MGIYLYSIRAKANAEVEVQATLSNWERMLSL